MIMIWYNASNVFVLDNIKTHHVLIISTIIKNNYYILESFTEWHEHKKQHPSKALACGPVPG